MTVDKTNEEWVYVFVSKSGKAETYLGLYDEEKGINFIPAFQNKEDANTCFLSIPREKGVSYEVQAVHIEEIHAEAAQNDFLVALVDKEGKIIKK
jgi:hypothetical protein